MKDTYQQSAAVIRTQFFNIDNGAGTTVDEPLFDSGPRGCRITRVYCIYGEATATVAAGNYRLGTAVGGAQIVAATAYVNSKAVGDVTEGVLALDSLPPNTRCFVRHTGVAITQTGTASMVVEYVPYSE